MFDLLHPVFSAVCGENPRHIWSPGGQPLPCCERCTGLYVAVLAAVALHLWFRPPITRRFLQLHALCLLQLGLFAFPWLPQSAALRTISGSLFGFGLVAFLWPAISTGHPLLRACLKIPIFRGEHTRPRVLRPAPSPVAEGHGSPIKRFSSWRMFLFFAARRHEEDARPVCSPFFRHALNAPRFKTGPYALGLAASLVLIPAIAEWGGTPGAFVLMCLLWAGILALAALVCANLVRCLQQILPSIFPLQLATSGRLAVIVNGEKQK